MSIPKTSIFTKRCFWLCLIAACVVLWLSIRLVDAQIIDVEDFAKRADQAFVDYEVLPARRGLIMDAKEEILTNNVQSSQLIADYNHLTDPKMISWGLAYSLAVHSEGWKELSEDKQMIRLKQYRAKLLSIASKKRGEQDEQKLAEILTSPAEVVVDENGDKVDMARKKLEEQYEDAFVEEYIAAHDAHAAALIAPILGVSEEELVEKIRQPGRENPIKRIVLASNLTEDKVEKIKEVLQKARVQGFHCETSLRRVYVAPTCMTHILGYVDFEGNGLTGVENKLDRYLLGQNGSREFRRDPRGLILPSDDDRFKAPVHGLNVRLTVDMAMQSIVEEELDAALATYRNTRGTIVVVEPKTGNILAMASRPHYDLNKRDNLSEGALNFAVQGIYEPGSTFKVIAATAAIDSRKATVNTVVSCTPIAIAGAKPVSDGNRHYGSLPIWGMLAKSSNPGAFNTARIVGWSIYKSYLKKFGIGQPTRVDLPSEGRGQMQDGSNLVNFSRISYGYSLTVTPLQMVMVYATIANDGVRMRPRLIDKIYSANGSVVENREPEVAERVMSSATAKSLRWALTQVVAPGGTARRAAIPGYLVGGKTGTAKKVMEKGGYFDNRYTVSFAGMVPGDKPAFVCLVVMDDPRPTDCAPGGGTVCAPIFKAVATRLLEVLKVPPTDPLAVIAAEKLAAEEQKQVSTSVASVSKKKSQTAASGSSRKARSESSVKQKQATKKRQKSSKQRT